MKFRLLILVILTVACPLRGESQTRTLQQAGYELRIRNFIDSLWIIDTHEHLLDPEVIKNSYCMDFSLLFLQNGYDDLRSAGLPDSIFNHLFNEEHSPVEKWELMSPYFKNTFNTSFSRIILSGIKDLYGIDELNESTVGILSEKIVKAYSSDWYRRILQDSCRIKYAIVNGKHTPGLDEYFRFETRFDSWLTVKSKFRIDSLAIQQVDPIFTLEDFDRSLRTAFEKEVKNGMVKAKVFVAYYRPLSFAKVDYNDAKKVFRSLINGEEDHVISFKDAKPLQDYMLYRLLDLAKEYDIPVAFHTGIQAGMGKVLGNTNPTLLTNLFSEYPEVKFVLYHGSYPFGGELSALAKNYRNVYIDLNWTFAISPSYTERYLNEWLETVPASKIMAFGGDCMAVENTYSELKVAKRIISKVLSDKVRDGYFSEQDAKLVAKMILFDNASSLYNLP
ncbi:MAG: amidohydrolase family protein [Bacteroidales bacterium]|jgi:predicted TIM-barrel fold metal-dependent hydrolase|nr:amidohydrolase family protein [Bacteroidales bacterium]